MTSENVDLVREAFEACSRGDVATMLEFVEPDLEWTYLDPSLDHPEPQVCHGRHELEAALARWADHGFKAELEEVAGDGDSVMVVMRTPRLDAHRQRQGDDRVYNVLTVRGG